MAPHTPCHTRNCSFRKLLDSLTPTCRKTVLQFLTESQVDHLLEHLQEDRKSSVRKDEREGEGGVKIPWNELTDGMERLAVLRGLEMELGASRAYGGPMRNNAGPVTPTRADSGNRPDYVLAPGTGDAFSVMNLAPLVQNAIVRSENTAPFMPFTPFSLQTVDFQDPRLFHGSPVFSTPAPMPVPVPPQYPTPPQYSPALPSSNVRPRQRTDYGRLFHESGLAVEAFNMDRFGFTILPNSRGAFIKPIPAWATLEMICANIRGGALERVDFHNSEGRTCVGIYFICAREAMHFIKYCKAQSGIYWAGCGIVSQASVEAIPRIKGGHEPIKINVSKGIREGATRVLRIDNLPNNINLEKLQKQIKSQSKHVAAEIETIQIIPQSAALHPKYTGFVRMSTIGTALGAHLKLKSLRYYKECRFVFMPDPCEASLEELKEKWNNERYWDSTRAAQKQGAPQLMQRQLQVWLEKSR
ncbi:hypothetical protein BDD12DRAFT_890400 [Trichophaea hybrida]|nr:hypothetical protein BDD12DRAFT_890400 [Trichophaea hybrida]